MAYFPTIALGLPFFKGSLIDAQASAFYDRVIADGGANTVVPTGLIGVSATFTAIKAIYGVSDITSALSVFYDPHYLAYKKGSGIGATAGQAIEKLYSACGASGDCVQATLTNQPLLLAHSGASTDNYWVGLNSSYCVSNTVISPTTQLDVKVELIASPNTTNGLTWISNDGPQRNFVFNCVDVTVGTLQLRAGTPFNNYNSTVDIGNLSNYTGWVRATYNQNGANGDVTFYTSTNGTTWTQLGAVVTIASSVLATGTHTIQLGANNTSNLYNGKIKRATISTTINGTSVVDFNPATYNAATSQTQWTSTTGEVWTFNTGTAATGYKGVLVDRTIIQGDGVDDNLTVASFASTQTYSEYIAHKRLGTGNLIAKATGNSLSNNATNFILNNGVALNIANTSLLRQLITTRNNGASSGQAINNGSETTGNAGTNNGTTLVISGGNFGINTYIQSILNDGSTVRTAIYNFIKTLNNNAF